MGLGECVLRAFHFYCRPLVMFYPLYTISTCRHLFWVHFTTQKYYFINCQKLFKKEGHLPNNLFCLSFCVVTVTPVHLYSLPLSLWWLLPWQDRPVTSTLVVVSLFNLTSWKRSTDFYNFNVKFSKVFLPLFCQLLPQQQLHSQLHLLLHPLERDTVQVSFRQLQVFLLFRWVEFLQNPLVPFLLFLQINLFHLLQLLLWHLKF